MLFDRKYLLQLLISLVPFMPIALYSLEVLCGVEYLKPSVVFYERLILGVVAWLILLRYFGDQ
jgi:hypothetical protein